MFAIQLRPERSNFIPMGRVANRDRAIPFDPPRQLVQFFDGCFILPSKRFHLLHVRAEIANLIQRVPSSQLDSDFTFDFGNRHRHVKQVPLWMFERNLILNCCFADCAKRQQGQKMQCQ